MGLVVYRIDDDLGTASQDSKLVAINVKKCLDSRMSHLIEYLISDRVYFLHISCENHQLLYFLTGFYVNCKHNMWSSTTIRIHFCRVLHLI